MELKAPAIFERINSTQQPSKDCTCIPCPHAIWYERGSSVSAFCTKMNTETWKFGTGGTVKNCSAFDAAVANAKEWEAAQQKQ